MKAEEHKKANKASASPKALNYDSQVYFFAYTCIVYIAELLVLFVYRMNLCHPCHRHC